MNEELKKNQNEVQGSGDFKKQKQHPKEEEKEEEQIRNSKKK